MRTYRVAIAALAGALISLPAWAVDSYTIDPNHTHPGYEISHFGWSTQRGRFDKATGMPQQVILGPRRRRLQSTLSSQRRRRRKQRARCTTRSLPALLLKSNLSIARVS